MKVLVLLLCPQVLVGRNFATFVTHTEGRYTYFNIGQVGFCVFAC